MITKEAVSLWENTNLFVQKISRQYDDRFAVSGAKIGETLRIRLPADYTLRVGTAASVQDTAQTSITLPVATQYGIDLSFSSQDLTMFIDDFGPLYIEPAVNIIAGGVATAIMVGSEGNVCNFVANVDGSNNILTPNATTITSARALLAQNSAPMADRMLVVDPTTNARAVGFLAGLFNPVAEISKQYRDGSVSNALGFTWLEDQTVIKHTTASYSGTLTVNGAGQTGSTITVNAITGGLAVGDIITFAGVHAVNRINKTSTGTLRQFTVTAAVATAGTSVSIFPALTPGSASYNATTGVGAVQYQTVDVSPANSATITVVSNSAAVFRKNIALIPEAVTMVVADFEIPANVTGSRSMQDNISMRYIEQYQALTDFWVRRLDVLFGWVWVRPEWAVIIADAI